MKCNWPRRTEPWRNSGPARSSSLSSSDDKEHKKVRERETISHTMHVGDTSKEFPENTRSAFKVRVPEPCSWKRDRGKWD